MQPNAGQHGQQETYESAIAPRASYVGTPPWISMFFWLGIGIIVISLARMIVGLVYMYEMYYGYGSSVVTYSEWIFDTLIMGLFYGFVLLGIGFHLKNQWKQSLQ